MALFTCWTARGTVGGYASPLGFSSLDGSPPLPSLLDGFMGQVQALRPVLPDFPFLQALAAAGSAYLIFAW